MRISDVKSILTSPLFAKIFFVMAVVGALPILVSGALALSGLTDTSNRRIANIEDSVILERREEIESFIGDIVENIFELIIVPDGDVARAVPLESQKAFLRGFLAESPYLDDVAFLTASELGQETARFVRTGQSPQEIPVARLRELGQMDKHRTARAGQVYIGPVYYVDRTGIKVPMMTIASPVKNADGEIIAVLSGELNLEPLLKIVQKARFRLGEQGYVYLVDEYGYAFAKSDDDAAFAYVGHVPLVGKVLAGENALRVENQRRYDSPFGMPVVAAGAPITQYGRFALIAEWPIAEAEAQAIALRDQIIRWSLAVLVAAILLSLVMASRIVRPVRLLEEGAQRVARGDFASTVAIRTDDELEDLGGAFNDMTKGLDELRKLKDEFVFIAAHELKTPVAAINGYIGLIAAGSGSEQSQNYLQKIKNANARLLRLVDDLLEVARSEAGRLSIQVAPVAIAPAISETLSELKPLADEKGIVMRYEPGDLPEVSADAGRVREVMINLVGNAIKYTKGNGVITISHEVAGGVLLTHVADMGIGMTPEEVSRLFQKFYRAANDDTRNIPGTGLGLFIVKQIIEKMRGEVRVSSAGRGKGSTFSFSLPIASKTPLPTG